MSKTILSIQNITKIYTAHGRTNHALNGVSFDIHEGEIFGLLGVNGAGKTTLSSIIATLHPPTAGDIFYFGKSIYKDINGYREELGFCPQTQNLDLALTVEENLIFAGRYFLMHEELIKRRTKALLEQLELDRYRNFLIHQLSGGTKQRVLIARALMHNPKIVILDEPTVGLDPDIRRKLWKIILDLKAMGITVILTTHYLDEAEILSDRVCFLNKGKVSLIESVASLREKHQMEKLEDIFIKVTQDTQGMN
jgi:ABC-2 type transport system ATP-binding protein